ncbi:MAG: PAS domain S-box protein [Pseudomonadales bacterium]|nr:PAS domain S-box protein [Pseudomonadales bacterium]
MKLLKLLGMEPEIDLSFVHKSQELQCELDAINRSQAVIEFDPNGNILSANENFLQLMGYSLNEIKSQHHRIFMDDASKNNPDYQSFWNSLKLGQFKTGQFKRKAKSGNEIWLQASYNPVVDDQGHTLKVVQYAVDITDQKLEQLASSGQVSAIDKSQAVIEFNMDGSIITANNNFLQTMGYSLAEVKGKNHSLFVSDSYKNSSEYQQFWQRLREGEYQSGEFKRQGKGGKSIWLQASYNPIFDVSGRPYKVIKYATDISHSKEEKNDLTSQISAIDKSQAVIEFNMDGSIITANNNFLSTIGYKLDEVQGKNHSLFVSDSYKSSSEYQQFWQRLRNGEFQTGEFHRLGKNGRNLWLQASYNPIFDLEGRPYKVLKFATDITVQKNEAIQNLLIRQSLDKSGANMMVADVNNVITYINDSALKLFSESQSSIRKAYASFDLQGIIGTDINTLVAGISKKTLALDKLSSSHHDSFKVADLSFEISVVPIFDNQGKRLGLITEWQDKSQEVDMAEQLQSVVASAVAGDLQARVSTNDKSGFFLAMSQSMNNLIELIEEVIGETIQVFSAMADGNLTQKISKDYQGAFAELKDDANASISNLVGVLGEIKLSSQKVNQAATEISSGNLDLSRRTEQQAASLEETASSMEQMTATIIQNTESSKNASSLASKTRDVAEQGGKVVEEAISAMGSISDASNKIADIISVIDEIAFQTNLLALNASVEAARAGEQGRGFAVVAGEVRNLAGRSATAAKEIKDLIEDSVKKVEEGKQLVNKSGESLTHIVGSVKEVSDLVAAIATASEEQSQGIAEVNRAVTKMDEMTQQNAALVEEVASTSDAMGSQARELQEQVEFFKTGESAQISSAPRPAMAASSAAPAFESAAAKTAAPAPATATAPAPADEDWAEF